MDRGISHAGELARGHETAVGTRGCRTTVRGQTFLLIGDRQGWSSVDHATATVQ